MWRYYNHALIPTTAPHEKVQVPNRNLFKNEWGGVALLARWTENFDCGYETKWWYVIKDTQMDLTKLKKKRRYEINKGNRNFDVKIINPVEYGESIYYVTKKAYEAYPKKYKPYIEKNEFINGLINWKEHEVYAAFFKETNELCGYAWIEVYENYIDFCCLKTNPEFEKYAINAAIVYAIVSKYNSKLSQKFYISDGERAILHETNFQNYLEKYFEFRKAYCNLKIKYRFPINIIIKVIYPFRKLIKGNTSFSSKVHAILRMESFTEK